MCTLQKVQHQPQEPHLPQQILQKVIHKKSFIKGKKETPGIAQKICQSSLWYPLTLFSLTKRVAV